MPKEYIFRIHTDDYELDPIKVVRALQSMFGFHFAVKEEQTNNHPSSKTTYPTLKEVESADQYQICAWHRFLPSPISDEQIKIIDRLCVRLADLGGFTPEISKGMGWKQ